MTATTSPHQIVEHAIVDRPTELLSRMNALPAGHPSRPRLREQVIEAWLPLSRRLAHRYAARGEPSDDLAQTAALGLVKAVDRFEPDLGFEFLSYAVPTIVGEIKRYFRDRTWSVRVPRRLQELRLSINAANSTLTHTLSRSPTVADIAGYLGVTEEDVLEGLEGARAYEATSLSVPIGRDNTTELGDILGEEDPAYELAVLRTALEPAMATLGDRDRTILTLRFYGNLTQSQIAQRVGLSQMHVSRLIAKALARLRTELDDPAV